MSAEQQTLSQAASGSPGEPPAPAGSEPAHVTPPRGADGGTFPLDALSWPYERITEALEALASASGLVRDVQSLRHAGLEPPRDFAALDGVVRAAGRFIGADIEAVECAYLDVAAMLRGCGPALLCIPHAGGPRFMAVAGRRRGRLLVIGPDLARHRVPVEDARQALCRSYETPYGEHVDRIIGQARLGRRRAAGARRVVLRECLRSIRIRAGWLLRQAPSTPFWSQLRRAGLTAELRRLVGARVLHHVAAIVSWWIIGAAALQGRVDRGWLAAWMLILLSAIPLRLLAVWSQGRFAIGAGGLLKRRLLAGALRLEPDEVRDLGAGQFLARVFESEAFESLALNAGFMGIMAAIEVTAAGVVLALGAAPSTVLSAFAIWLVLTAFGCWRYYLARRRWTDARLNMTHDLTERMVGHRTRLAQESPATWHDGEDQLVAAYYARAREVDRVAARVQGFLMRGWPVVGFMALIPALLVSGTTPAALAVGLGGVLLAQRALQKLALGLASMSDAAIVWNKVQPLYRAAERAGEPGSALLALGAASRPAEPRVLRVSEVTFKYPSRAAAVLQGCDLDVRRGDRILVEGPSGGGKSTLVAVLLGLRSPHTGTLLLSGFDRRSWGEECWRRRIVGAPQFHENHVLTGSLAFNLLIGRRWPPEDEDLRQAEAVCRELGLGPLLERMPGGLRQMVGESGWQLSHGEKSRVFVARALLHGADLIVLDESFAALDPENLATCCRCVAERAPSLLVVAHP